MYQIFRRLPSMPWRSGLAKSNFGGVLALLGVISWLTFCFFFFCAAAKLQAPAVPSTTCR